MQRLILLRHAKSAYPSGVRDHDRPLNARGRANAAVIAERLRPFLRDDASVQAAVSTAVRAQETWAIANRELEIDHWSDRSLYLAEPAVLLEAASAFDSNIGILVGHNPGLEDLSRSVEGASRALDPHSQSRLVDKFPTSTFAVLDSPNGSWRVPDMICVAFAVCR